ncbi:MAG: YhfL family protein [Anaeroplasmataceae bacterium]|nr:YhfL family protein [Anaeroplasmataceae bacterium]
MKKLFLICLLGILIFVMTSCSNRGAYFLEGEFYSKENNCNKESSEYNEDYQYAILKLKAIDKATYLKAKGLNVVRDTSDDRDNEFYLVELLVFSKQKNDYIQLDYNNLQREPHRHANCYSDDNGYILDPHELKRGTNTSWKYTASNKGYCGEFYLMEEMEEEVWQ